MSCAQPPPEITLLLKTTASGNFDRWEFSSGWYAHVFRSDSGHSTWAKSTGCSDSLPQCLTVAPELFQKSDGRRHNKPAASVTLCSKWAWEKNCTVTKKKNKTAADFLFLTQSTKTRFRRRTWQCTRIACGTSALNLDAGGNAGPDQATLAAWSMLHQPRVSMVAVKSHLASYPSVGEKCRNSSTTFSSST